MPVPPTPDRSDAVTAAMSPDKEFATLIANVHRLSDHGRYGEALALISSELSGHPGDGELSFARASVWFDWGRVREAHAGFLQAEACGLQRTALYLNLTWSCHLLRLDEEAERYARKAVALDASSVEAHFGLGAVLQRLKRYPEAITSYERAFALAPDDAKGAAGIAHCKLEQFDYVGAEEWMRRAVALAPDSPQFRTNLGVAYANQGRYVDSLRELERAGELESAAGAPPESTIDMGFALVSTGQYHRAFELFRKHLPRLPDPRAHGYYAFLLLALGRFREGWAQYEFRWMQEPHLSRRPNYSQPRWSGQDLSGKTLLLIVEQGAGDIIHFARYAALLKAMGATVVLQSRPEIVELARWFAGIDQVFAPPDPPPPFDYHIHLMSIPHVLGTELSTVPADVPYVSVDPAKSQQWTERIAGPGLKVGMVWAGNPKYPRDHFRSIEFDRLSPLWDLQGVRFYSLQKPLKEGELERFPTQSTLHNLAPALADFTDTAAAIDRLDLIICVDTAIAHLAGALGKPVWLLLPEVGDFRWLEGREDSPWYPTMRLFRQRQLGEWGEVVTRVKTTLEEAVRTGSLSEAFRPSDADATGTPADPMEPEPPQSIARVAESRHGILQYLPDSDPATQSIAWYGDYLQPQLELLARLIGPGAWVVEAGSGIGAHAVALAKLVGAEGHVMAYEPRPVIQQILRQNLEVNRVSGIVTVMRRALGGSDAVVPADTVDALLLDRLDLLKVRSGADAVDILEGAAATLWRLRPLLFLAAQDEAALGQLCRQVSAYGYRCWRMVLPLFAPGNFNRREEDIFAGEVALALLAIPEERNVSFVLNGCEPIGQGAVVAHGAFTNDKPGLFGKLRKLFGSVPAPAPAPAAPDNPIDPSNPVLSQIRTLIADGRFREARDTCRRAMAAGLSDAEVELELGWAQFQCGDAATAQTTLRRALARGADSRETQTRLARVLFASGRFLDATALLTALLERSPMDAELLWLLGNCKANLGDATAAERCLRSAVAADPDRAVAWKDLGAVLNAQGRQAEAIAASTEAVRLDAAHGEHSDSFINLAIELADDGRLAEALALHENELPQQPYVYGYIAYAQALLKAGRLREGWRHYEFRVIAEALLAPRQEFGRPAWAGQDLAGKTMLLLAEQGLGDTIQFIRYAPRLKALGATVLLRVPDGLEDFAVQFPGVDRVLERGTTRVEFDYYVNVLSLPQVLGIDLGAVPGDVPYLRADPTRDAHWAARLQHGTKLKVGVVWAGNPNHAADRLRSMPLSALAPLGALDGVQFLSLQKGTREHEAKSPPPGLDWVDLGPELADFRDTAAAITHMDIVLSVDTAVAHLAGALGKPVWLMVAKSAEWRWMESREDSPWYPTMRLFRQQHAGDWGGVIERVGAALRALARGESSAVAPSAATNALPAHTTGVRRDFSAVAQMRSGILQYLPNDLPAGESLRYYGELLQPQLDTVLQRLRPGMTVMESGSGIGAHATVIAEAIGTDGHLIVDEPRPVHAQILRQNLAVRRLHNVTPLRPAYARSVDDLQLERLDLLKVVADAAAKDVIDGAAATLWRLRPELFVAVPDALSLTETAARLREFGYRCWRMETAWFNPSNFNRRDDDVFAGRTALALLAVPEEVEAGMAQSGCVELS
jgi:tetratricopeptide (TPR) repeat protein/tRNA A58 N-methylase Trm61